MTETAKRGRVSGQAAAKELSLDDLVAELPERQRKTAQIDVSEFFPAAAEKSGEPVLFHYEDPDPNTYVTAGRDVPVLREIHPDWSEDFIGTLLLIALCHKRPRQEKQSVGRLYVAMAEREPQLFLKLLREFFTQFPHLQNLDAAAAEKKSGSGAATT